MTNAAVLDGRHVVGRLAARRNAVAGGTVVDDSRMVRERAGEAIGVVAISTIRRGYRMAADRR